jgi:hypothetical protein
MGLMQKRVGEFRDGRKKIKNLVHLKKIAGGTNDNNR